MTGPANVAVVLLDSLNRHMLGAYGGQEFETPTLDAFAREAIRFDRHYTGSLPCIPARHDLLVGAWDFLWRPWGSIELWEEPVTVPLRRAGVATKLVSDHPHLFETGGENYHVDFTAWAYERGHESDPWRTRPDPTWMGTPSFSQRDMPYERSRPWFRGEDDFPGPRTMQAAARWLDEEASSHSRWFLFIDEFDPHEPFDTPEPYASMYDPDWEGPHLIWPPYVRGAMRKGVLDERQARQIRASYGAKLTMIDHWLGEVLRRIDYTTTAVIVCTDHGHYLGEKDVWGKPGVPVYEPLGHMPLLVRWPGVRAGAVDALTTSADVFATVCDVFGVSVEHRTHGVSLRPLVEGTATSVRDWALTGVWGREVHFVDAGGTKYARAPAGDNAPLSMWSNRWSTMPITMFPDIQLPKPDDRAWLDRMPGSTVPVIRQPFQAGDLLPYWAGGSFPAGNQLFSIDDDPLEEDNRAGTPAEKEAADKLRQLLLDVEAPADQFERLGLA